MFDTQHLYVCSKIHIRKKKKKISWVRQRAQIVTVPATYQLPPLKVRSSNNLEISVLIREIEQKDEHKDLNIDFVRAR